MGSFIYVMAIMGCGDGGLGCEQVRTLETRYESLAACQQAAQTQLIAHGDIDFPEVMASCQSVTNRIAAVTPPTRAR